MAITFEISPITSPPNYAGVPISIIAQNVAGGTPPYYYAFYEFNGVSWTLKQDYSENNSFVWRPSTIGPGQFIQVWIKDSLHVGPDPYDAWEAFEPITVVANGSWIRYNENDKRYEISKNVGLTWSPLDLSGDLALLAATYQNFTGKISFGTPVNPNLIGDNGDICVSRVSAPGSGAIYFGNTLAHFLYWSGAIFLTSGPLSVGGSIVERGRNTAIGEWITPSFDAANFSAAPNMTWTVAASGVLSYKYKLVGKSLKLNFFIKGTTGGVASNELRIAIPGGFTIVDEAVLPVMLYENGASMFTGYAIANTGNTFLSIFKNDWSGFSLGVDRWVAGQLDIEI